MPATPRRASNEVVLISGRSFRRIEHENTEGKHNSLLFVWQ